MHEASLQPLTYLQFLMINDPDKKMQVAYANPLMKQHDYKINVNVE